MFRSVLRAWPLAWPAWRLARCAALAAALLAAWGAGTGAAAAPVAAEGGIAQQVDAIEAASGGDPEQVVKALRGLEAKAHAHGGPDLVKFLAAWGYAHGALNQPVVADAAVEELTRLGAGAGPETHAALASAYALKANLLQFSGRLGTALDWINAATDQARLVGDPHLQYWVFMSAGDIAVATGRLELAVQHLSAALGPARATRNDRRQAQVHLALAPLYLALDRPAQAAAAARTGRRLPRWPVSRRWCMRRTCSKAWPPAAPRPRGPRRPRPAGPRARRSTPRPAGPTGWPATWRRGCTSPRSTSVPAATRPPNRPRYWRSSRPISRATARPRPRPRWRSGWPASAKGAWPTARRWSSRRSAPCRRTRTPPRGCWR
ncbi:MAG: tetratricopeptide repeat protein [Burkholderiaceae bacterium]